MLNIKSIRIFILFSVSAFATISCSSDNSWIIGKWQHESNSSIEFMNDGRVLSYIPDIAGLGSSSVIGKYKFIDTKRLLIIWDRPSNKDVFFQYILLSNKTLLLEVPEQNFREIYNKLDS